MFANYPLIKAVNDGNEDDVDQLIKDGADVNAKTSSERQAADGFTALHVLCSGKRDDPVFQRILAKLLTSKGIDLNPFNTMGDTPLITASYYGRSILVLRCSFPRFHSFNFFLFHQDD